MLLEAKRAGEALIEAKKQCRHGEFQKWVSENTRLSQRTANDYMRVAIMAFHKVADLRYFEGGIQAFLAECRERVRGKPEPAAPAFTQADAEYALKLKALADRGGTEAEGAVASKKLDSFAQGFGLTND